MRSRVAKIAAGVQVDVDRPTLDSPEYVDSENELFRVHFTRVGTDAVPLDDKNGNLIPDYVENAVRALDSGRLFGLWHGGGDVEIPNDGDKGGSSALDVYLRDLSKSGPGGSGYYGITQIDSLVRDSPEETWNRYTTWIEIDNDFSPDDRNLAGQRPYATFGEDALRVTCAHEYHHVIQVGAYGDAKVELMIYEMMSTWMENAVYPEIDDWVTWASRMFNMPQDWPLSEPTASNGYTWGWFIKAFEPQSTTGDIVTGTLRQIKSGKRPFTAFVGACIECKSRLDSTFVNALPAMYATGERGEDNTVIHNAELLPEIQWYVDEQARVPSAIYTGRLKAFEVRAFRIGIPSNTGGPPVSVVAMLTWPDIQAFVNSNETTLQSYTLTFTASPSGSDIPIQGSNWGIRVEPPSIAAWFGGGVLTRIGAPYPNPLVMSEQRVVNVPVGDAIPGDVATIQLLNVQTLGIDEKQVTVELDDFRIVAPYEVPQGLTPGTYLLNVQFKESSHLLKIMVKR